MYTRGHGGILKDLISSKTCTIHVGIVLLSTGEPEHSLLQVLEFYHVCSISPPLHKLWLEDMFGNHPEWLLDLFWDTVYIL
jgi:hypothetical protein